MTRKLDYSKFTEAELDEVRKQYFSSRPQRKNSWARDC